MDSLVLDLQRLASDSKERLSDLLRKALVVATKLSLDDFRVWIEKELNGYRTAEVPEYRIRSSQYYVRNPYHGLQPVVMPDAKTEKAFCEIRIAESVESLQHLLEPEGKSGSVEYRIPPEYEVHLRNSADLLGLPLVRLGDTNNLSSILDTVRTTILQWALKLESEGILGEGMSFSSDEKQKAMASPQINIQNFHGILGNVNGSQITQYTRVNIQKNDFVSLRSAMLDLGIDSEDVGRLEAAIKEDPPVTQPDKFGPRVGKWLGSMVQKAAEGASKIGVNVASAVLAEALKKYYGF